jgi:uncharacterized membrane protein YeaQ/YmgE (transglycosylase-associated protein family)
MDIALGVAGAFVGGCLFNHYFGVNGITGLNIYSLAVAATGAAAVLLIYHLVSRRKNI